MNTFRSRSATIPLSSSTGMRRAGWAIAAIVFCGTSRALDKRRPLLARGPWCGRRRRCLLNLFGAARPALSDPPRPRSRVGTGVGTGVDIGVDTGVFFGHHEGTTPEVSAQLCMPPRTPSPVSIAQSDLAAAVKGAAATRVRSPVRSPVPETTCDFNPNNPNNPSKMAIIRPKTAESRG